MDKVLYNIYRKQAFMGQFVDIFSYLLIFKAFMTNLCCKLIFMNL